MDMAIKEAKKAYHKNEIPVGAVIIKNNKLISKGHNQKEKKHNVIKHAEIIAIEKACKKLKSWHLNECTIYISLEPCMMCTGAIVQSRIKNIVYATENPNYGYLVSNYEILKRENLNIKKANFNYHQQSSYLLKSFFKNKRK